MDKSLGVLKVLMLLLLDALSKRICEPRFGYMFQANIVSVQKVGQLPFGQRHQILSTVELQHVPRFSSNASDRDARFHFLTHGIILAILRVIMSIWHDGITDSHGRSGASMTQHSFAESLQGLDSCHALENGLHFLG